MPSREPDVWQMIFEQTPTILRWLLGVLSLGLFTLLSILYRWNKKDADEVKQDINRLHGRIDRVEDKQDQIYQLLLSRSDR